MFRGRFEHSLDEKGRLAIPTRFRDQLLEDGQGATLIVTNMEQCLAVYGLEEWERLEKKLASQLYTDPKVHSFIRYFISGAIECPMDKAGRILIPPGLRDFAEIQRDCVVAGQLTKIEIWSADRWKAMFAILKTQFGSLTSGMASIGINL